MNYQPFKYEEICDLSYKLEEYSSLFYTLWVNILPVYTDDIDTMELVFCNEASIYMIKINPKYWNTLTDYTKIFNIAHECIHILYDHGKRSDNIKEEDKPLAHVAMDLSVNHSLVNNFGFKRSLLNEDDYYWVDTVFSKPFPDTNLSFEAYYNFLKNSKPILPEDPKGSSHEGFSTNSTDPSNKLQEQTKFALAEEISKNADSEDISAYNKGVGTGYVGEPAISGTLKKLSRKIKKVKYNWSKVVNKWTRYSIKEKEDYQWATDDRRFTSIVDKNLLLPQMGLIEDIEFDKVNVSIYLDTSGSCAFLVEPFLDAVSSLDPKKFKARYFSRNVEVKEIFIKKNKKPYIDIGGSDNFSAIEWHIQQEKAEGKPYPDLVFHFTDGYDCSGYMVNPEKPERWHWILDSPDEFDITEQWIPKNSHIYRLKDLKY